MKIFVINGHNQVGKDTFVSLLEEIGFKEDKTIANTSTIDIVKEYAKMLGWDGTKTSHNRRFLSDIKDALTRWEDVPYTSVQDKIKIYNELGYDGIFIHCREPEEIKRFVEDYHATTILVQRPQVEQCKTNHADNNVDNFDYDIIVDNSRGLAELKEGAKTFYELFI